jgi:uncharacterized protein
MVGKPQKLVLAGGTGFLGQLLARWFHRLNWDVVILTRRNLGAEDQSRTVRWDGKTVGDWAAELEAAAAVVNLSGVSVNCRYHARNRRAILASRVESTRALGRAIQGCTLPPKVWLNSSTATIYKHAFDRSMDEATGLVMGSPEANDLFSVEVAKAWEQTFFESPTPSTRRVALRTAMVMSTQPGTVYRILRRLVRCGLGGAMGSGRQYVSWIHEEDFCRAVEWLIAHDSFSGIVNLAAPQPLPNREMMRILRTACHLPIGLPASRWMLETGAIVLRTETELILKSRRVVPARLSQEGFEFRFPELTSAVADLEQNLAHAS